MDREMCRLMPNLTIRVPEVLPLGWLITRYAIEDVWDLFVAPSQGESGLPTPELRALAALLREVWRALPEQSEPRRYLPTLQARPGSVSRFRLDGEGDA